MAKMKLLVAFCALAAITTTAQAQQPGKESLDEALELKLTADNIFELGRVIRLCEEALEAGLDEEDKEFCDRLLASTLMERGARVGRTVLAGAAGPLGAREIRQLVQLRQAALDDLERAVKLEPKTVEGHYLIGRLHALPGGDQTKALTALSTVIALGGDDPQTLGRAHLSRAELEEDPQRRLKDYNAAVEVLPDKVEALQSRAMFHLEEEHYAEALADAEKALELEPEDSVGHELRGMAYEGQEKLDEARAAYSKAIELSPRSNSALIRRARVFLLQDKGAQAVEDIDRVLALGQPTAGLLLLRAGAHQSAGDEEAAMKDVNSALELAPNMPEALRARAVLLAGKGKVAEAIGDLESLVDGEGNDTQALQQLALLYLSNNQNEKAIETLTKIVEKDPKNVEALRLRADAWLRVGKHALAAKDYERSLKLAPEDDHVLNNLAWLLATSPEDSVRDAERAIELAKRACKVTGYEQAHILSTLAAGYAEKGDFKTAIEWSTKAVEKGEGDIKEQLQQELESYKQGKPWRERQGEESSRGESP